MKYGNNHRKVVLGENMYSNIIVDKSFDFSVSIIKFYKVLINTKKEYIIGKQLLRSGTSIGANVKEGIKAISRADFRNKMSIALKEANECEYWLELMVKSEVVSKDEVCELLKDCKELCKILGAIVKTTR